MRCYEILCPIIRSAEFAESLGERGRERERERERLDMICPIVKYIEIRARETRISERERERERETRISVSEREGARENELFMKFYLPYNLPYD